jgi:hypothetical protein
VEAYRLDQWEIYALWTAAGFTPAPGSPSTHQHDLHELATLLLTALPFPACMVDSLGYLVAWNQGIEAIWSPSRADRAHIHVLDDLFSSRLRHKLGEKWEAYVLLALRLFYHSRCFVASGCISSWGQTPPCDRPVLTRGVLKIRLPPI